MNNKHNIKVNHVGMSDDNNGHSDHYSLSVDIDNLMLQIKYKGATSVIFEIDVVTSGKDNDVLSIYSSDITMVFINSIGDVSHTKIGIIANDSYLYRLLKEALYVLSKKYGITNIQVLDLPSTIEMVKIYNHIDTLINQRRIY